jgi:hypothetical protein
MKRWGSIAVIVLLFGLTVPASANTPDWFTACGHLSGEVQPPHASLEAEVWHKGPDDTAWELWTTVDINAHGVMKYEWHTTQADGQQENAHFVQFRIEGHGKSNKVKVYVWLGE